MKQQSSREREEEKKRVKRLVLALIEPETLQTSCEARGKVSSILLGLSCSRSRWALQHTHTSSVCPSPASISHSSWQAGRPTLSLALALSLSISLSLSSSSSTSSSFCIRIPVGLEELTNEISSFYFLLSLPFFSLWSDLHQARIGQRVGNPSLVDLQTLISLDPLCRIPHFSSFLKKKKRKIPNIFLYFFVLLLHGSVESALDTW